MFQLIFVSQFYMFVYFLVFPWAFIIFHRCFYHNVNLLLFVKNCFYWLVGTWASCQRKDSKKAVDIVENLLQLSLYLNFVITSVQCFDHT